MKDSVANMQPADLRALRQLAVRVSRRHRSAADDLEAATAMAEALIAFVDEVRRLRTEIKASSKRT
jgi:hypothetical protein